MRDIIIELGDLLTEILNKYDDKQGKRYCRSKIFRDGYAFNFISLDEPCDCYRNETHYSENKLESLFKEIKDNRYKVIYVKENSMLILYDEYSKLYDNKVLSTDTTYYDINDDFFYPTQNKLQKLICEKLENDSYTNKDTILKEYKESIIGIDKVMTELFENEFKDSNVRSLKLYIINPDPIKWVGNYGLICCIENNKKVISSYEYDINEVAYIKDIINNMKNYKIVRDYSDESLHKRIFIFVGDWEEKSDILFYNKKLNEFYCIGADNESPVWWNSDCTSKIIEFVEKFNHFSNKEFSNYII